MTSATLEAGGLLRVSSAVGLGTPRSHHSCVRTPAVRRFTGLNPSPYQEVATMADTVRDPVCGMEIRPEDAAATEEHDGGTYYFCSPGCHEAFVKDPHRYGHPSDEHGAH